VADRAPDRSQAGRSRHEGPRCGLGVAFHPGHDPRVRAARSHRVRP
jgi:hypothetical protein